MFTNCWKIRENVGVDFFQILVFCFFVTHTTKNSSPIAQKIRENVGIDFFSNSCFFHCLFLLFVTHSAAFRFRYTRNILCMFTNCSKIFVKMLMLIFFHFLFVFRPKTFFVCSPITQKNRQIVGVSFFQFLGLFIKVLFFCHTLCCFPFPLHYHSLYVHKFSVKTQHDNYFFD